MTYGLFRTIDFFEETLLLNTVGKCSQTVRCDAPSTVHQRSSVPQLCTLADSGAAKEVIRVQSVQTSGVEIWRSEPV